ncbi:MAG: D-alanyl-D-alanine carboxypeptidase family protein, partial [Oscillospiraceae bacterium]|nr:D-alanyl-D-alanine carboxypeptidase family protein [Oscillospiraceae bacterium]
MKKRVFCLWLLLCCCFSFIRVYAEEAVETTPPATVSESYAVIDADSGQVYISKNASVQKYPASITKILTLALFFEKTGGSMEGTLTVSQTAIDALEYGASTIALQPGEVISLEDAVMATALMSANDAANCLAEYTAGSLPAFADMMNRKLEEIGCTGTHFVNPNGLHDPQHYTTAADMAAITRYALTVPGVLTALSTDSYLMRPTNLQSEERPFGTGHAMFVQSTYTYEGALGGKTGWTPEARHTMVTVAERGGRRLICVVMDSPQKWDKYKDTIALLDYCFDTFQQVEYPSQEIPSFTMAVYQDGEYIGKVTAVTPVCTFALHKTVALQDVVWRYEDVPKTLAPGDTAQPYIAFYLKGEVPSMQNALPRFAMPVQGMEACVAKAGGQSIEQAKEPFTVPGWVWPVGGIFVLFAVLYGIRRFNLYRRKLRHRARMLARRQAIAAGSVRRT